MKLLSALVMATGLLLITASVVLPQTVPTQVDGPIILPPGPVPVPKPQPPPGGVIPDPGPGLPVPQPQPQPAPGPPPGLTEAQIRQIIQMEVRTTIKEELTQDAAVIQEQGVLIGYAVPFNISLDLSKRFRSTLPPQELYLAPLSQRVPAVRKLYDWMQRQNRDLIQMEIALVAAFLALAGWVFTTRSWQVAANVAFFAAAVPAWFVLQEMWLKIFINPPTLGFLRIADPAHYAIENLSLSNQPDFFAGGVGSLVSTAFRAIEAIQQELVVPILEVIGGFMLLCWGNPISRGIASFLTREWFRWTVWSPITAGLMAFGVWLEKSRVGQPPADAVFLLHTLYVVGVFVLSLLALVGLQFVYDFGYSRVRS